MQKSKVDSCDSLPIEKILRLIKSVLDKDKNHYYYKIILEKCSYQLIKKFFFHNMTLRFKDTKVPKEKFHAPREPLKIWDVNVDNIVISKLVKIS